jgi:hypothetical protein
VFDEFVELLPIQSSLGYIDWKPVPSALPAVIIKTVPIV